MARSVAVRVFVAAQALAVAACVLSRAEPVTIAQEASGSLELDGETRLRVERLRGVVQVKLGEEEQLRFLSTAMGQPERELPVSLTLDGGTLALRAVDGAEELPRTLWVSVPAGLSVELLLEETKVITGGLRDGLTVEGEKLDFYGKGIGGRLEIDLVGGIVRAIDTGGDATVHGGGLTAELSGVEGSLDLHLTDSQVMLNRVHGTTDAELEGSTLVAREIDGGDLRLTGTPLQLEGSSGNILVETDSEVHLEENEASMRVDGHEASIFGSGIRGSLHVSTYRAEVSLDTVAAPLRIDGDGLDVQVAGVEDDLTLQLTASTVNVERADGPVTVHNDFGDVHLRDTKGATVVKSRDGNVTVRDARGTVEIDADGERVEVAWVSMPTRGDSSIKNERGDVSVWFTGGGGCLLRAVTRFGKIESDRRDVRVSDDGESATGYIKRKRRPTLLIDSGGDIYLLSGAPPRERP
jgi:hypothetical protein